MQPDPRHLHELLRQTELRCEEMIEQQRRKVLKIAQGIRANVTDDDILDPTSIPELVSNPVFAYEEGLYHGLVAAKVAIMRDGRNYLRAMVEGAESW